MGSSEVRRLALLCCTNIQYFAWNASMQSAPSSTWIAACAQRLQQQWHTVDPRDLEDVARDLWSDERIDAAGRSCGGLAEANLRVP